MSDIHLISGYRGNSVAGLTGSSVNFSWSFSKGTKGVRGVLFGLIKDQRARDFIPKGILVAFGESGNPAYVPVPVEYNGRVGGSYDGNKSTGHAIFTLSSIKKDDERFFGCRVSPQNNFDTEVFDSVYLNVAGGLPILLAYNCRVKETKNLHKKSSELCLHNLTLKFPPILSSCCSPKRINAHDDLHQTKNDLNVRYHYNIILLFLFELP